MADNPYVQRHRGFQSQLELNVLRLIEQIIPPEPTQHLPGYANFVGSRPSFLRSPKGGRLELDIWIPGLPLAIEVQGEQHEKWNRKFFRRKADWEYYLECDEIKRKVMWELRCPYLEVKWNDKLTVPNLVGKLRTMAQAYPPEHTERLRTILDLHSGR
jgi:hypothetical protein